jgi:hypothetical protein
MYRTFRMKALPLRPELDKLLRESAEAVRHMTPEEHNKMLQAQRESWSRQDMD